MINYSRLGYEIKRDLSNFSSKISKSSKRPKEKFVQQMVYGILASNSVHLSEISRSLKETITLKKRSNAFPGTSMILRTARQLWTIIFPW